MPDCPGVLTPIHASHEAARARSSHSAGAVARSFTFVGCQHKNDGPGVGTDAGLGPVNLTKFFGFIRSTIITN